MADKPIKIVMPVYNDVNMLDVAGPHEMFIWAKISVDLVAEKPGTLNFRKGFPFKVEKSFADVAATTYDALWVPGGDVSALADIINNHPAFLKFLRDQAEKVTWVCSVCEGAMLLAAAPLLDGYTATTHWAFVPCFNQYFPKVIVADGFPRFCLDRNRLTGGGISSGLDEALRLIELLKGTAVAKNVQQQTQYYPDPPVMSEFPKPDECPLENVHLPLGGR